MSRVREWASIALKELGLDKASLEKMSPLVKWSGILFILFCLVLAVLDIVGVLDHKTQPVQELVQQQLKATSENTAMPTNNSKVIASIFGWISVVLIGLALLMQPKGPKRDGRFKTGYKNNATFRKLSPQLLRVQIGAALIGIAAGILWDYLK